MKKIFLALALVMGVSAAAQAQSVEVSSDQGLGLFEIALGLGSTRHAGYLSDKDKTGDLDLGFRFYNPNGRGMWEIFIAGTETEARSDYGFAEGANTKISVAGMGPVVLFPCDK